MWWGRIDIFRAFSGYTEKYTFRRPKKSFPIHEGANLEVTGCSDNYSIKMALKPGIFLGSTRQEYSSQQSEG